MNVITKEAVVTSVESSNPNGEFDVLLSTSDLDRDNERLHSDEWKMPLPEHITFDSDHGMSVATTVGSGKPFINDSGQLQVRGTFASTAHAQTVRTLVAEGHITKTSVAYSEKKGTKDAKPVRELLNGAFVAVPANEKAVVLSSKSIAERIDALLLTKGANTADGAPPHDAMVQAIHDAAFHLGAMCQSNIGSDDGATDGANKGIKTSGVEAGSSQESPESEPAEAATKAAATQAPADVPADAAKPSFDVVALRARSLAFLIKTSMKEQDNAE